MINIWVIISKKLLKNVKKLLADVKQAIITKKWFWTSGINVSEWIDARSVFLRKSCNLNQFPIQAVIN